MWVKGTNRCHGDSDVARGTGVPVATGYLEPPIGCAGRLLQP